MELIRITPQIPKSIIRYFRTGFEEGYNEVVNYYEIDDSDFE